MNIATGQTALSIKLDDGEAHFMGDGLVVVMQRDAAAKRAKMQSVVLSRGDVEAIGASVPPLTVTLEDGEALHLGEGTFVISQRDTATQGAPMQNVALSANDAAAILAMAA